MDTPKESNGSQMKALVFSDLHIPYNRRAPKVVIPMGVDVVVVAGDITAPIRRSMEWLQTEVASQGKPVVFVAGNHEHYGQTYESSLLGGVQARKDFPGVHFLEDSEVVIDGVRFVGSTLWTDYNLHGLPERSMRIALNGLNDYNQIRSTVDPDGRGMFTPGQSRELHLDSLSCIEAMLDEPFAGKTVVVTHHCPHPLSIAEKYHGDEINPAFTSDLTAFIEKHQPDLWVHGHTHSSFDYVVPGTKTRVVCNPKGYIFRKAWGDVDENPEFDINMIVEI